MTSFDLYLIVAWIGYALAIWLYYGLGKIFWVPIALDLVYDILGAKFNIWGDNVETLVIMTAYNVLLLLWVLFMSGLMKTKWATLIAFGLVMVASFTGMASTAVYQNIGVERFAEFVGLPGFHRKWILLAILTMYTWSTVTFLSDSRHLTKQHIISMAAGPSIEPDYESSVSSVAPNRTLHGHHRFITALSRIHS